MKTEEFDDAVRKKLESINHTYSEGDIEKVFQHVKKNRGFSWKGLNSSWFIYTLSAAAMVSVTTWMVLRPAYRETPAKQVVPNTVKNSFNNLPSIVNADTLTNALPDTKQTEPKSETNTESVKTYVLPSVNTQVFLNKAVPQKNNTVEPEPVQNNVTKEKTDNSTIAANQSVLIKEDSTRNQQNQKSISQGKSTAILPEVVVEAKIPEDVPKSKNNDVQPVSEITETKISINQASIKDSVGLKTSLSLNADTTSKTETANGQNQDFRIRPSVLFTISNQKKGIGLAGDLLFGKNLGFSLGITYNVLKEEQFQDKADFYGHRPHGMNPQIDHHLGGPEHVSDISIQSQLLQLPLSFNYFIPLKRNFVIRMSLGTDLDVYLNQKLSFTHPIDSSRAEYPHFNTQGKVVPFNTLYFGAGIEKRWNHWVISVQPYYNQRIKEVFYKPKESEFGIGVSVLYSFGK